uniref:Uncharacterized protein n=1 Tax=Oryza brachyantha TaxID=4533 RepID=J3LV65_ORYBR
SLHLLHRWCHLVWCLIESRRKLPLLGSRMMYTPCTYLYAPFICKQIVYLL